MQGLEPVQHEQDSGLPARILQSALQQRLQKNPSYSLRALARDLGVSHTFLSLVMSGKKPLSVERATQIAEILCFTRAETRRFIQAVVLNSPSKRGGYALLRGMLQQSTQAPKRGIEFFDLEQDRFRAMNGWWHFAILDLMTCDDARADAGWISKRLGITTLMARDAIDRLLRLGLLTEQDGRWMKVHEHMLASVNRPDTLMRMFHKDLIGKALKTISESTSAEEVARRDVLSMTVAVNPNRLDAARELVTEFQNRLVECLTDGACTEVYQLNYQFLPLTRLRERT
jgi:uncharacterized protein (TIGR02147 family)